MVTHYMMVMFLILYISITGDWRCSAVKFENEEKPENIDQKGPYEHHRLSQESARYMRNVSDPEWLIEKKISIFHRAALDGCEEVTENLLHSVSRSHLNHQDLHDGATPLLWAAMVGEIPIMDIFYDNGANILATDDRMNTALHLAAMYGHAETCWWLLERGVDPDAVNDVKDSALHLAVKGGHFYATLRLLNFGAKSGLLNGQGETALDIASKEDHLRIKKLLQSRVPPGGRDPKTGNTIEKRDIHNEIGTVDNIPKYNEKGNMVQSRHRKMDENNQSDHMVPRSIMDVDSD